MINIKNNNNFEIKMNFKKINLIKFQKIIILFKNKNFNNF